MAAKQLLGACALIMTVGAAQAANRGFYFGASGGQAKYDFNLPAVPVPVAGFLPPAAGIVPDPTFVFRPNPGNPVFITPVPAGAVFFSARPVLWLPGDDEEGTSWGVGGGYRFNRYLALEASYVNLGTLNATHTLNMPPFLGGGTLAFHRELETTGPALAAFGILPISDSWELFVRAGIMFADTDLTTRFNGSRNSVSFDSEPTTLGAGAQFDWQDHWSARLEFQRSFDVGGDDVASEADVDGVSLAVIYRL
jgi:opacity protein-like surface antigen